MKLRRKFVELLPPCLIFFFHDAFYWPVNTHTTTKKLPTYLPTYLQLLYYSKVRAAEHYCETNRGGLGRCPRASAVRQDTGTPLRPRLPHPRNCSKVALRLTQVLLPCAPTREQVPPVREDSRF